KHVTFVSAPKRHDVTAAVKGVLPVVHAIEGRKLAVRSGRANSTGYVELATWRRRSDTDLTASVDIKHIADVRPPKRHEAARTVQGILGVVGAIESPERAARSGRANDAGHLEFG